MFSYVKLDGESKFELRKTNKSPKIFFEGSPINHYIKVHEMSSAVVFVFFTIFQMLLKSRILILGQRMTPHFKDLNLLFQVNLTSHVYLLAKYFKK